VVLLHTGWINLLDHDRARYGAAEPGITPEAAKYLAKLDIVAVGSDTWGLEVVPFRDPSKPWEGHQTLLAKHGVYILETMDTRELAKDEAYEFMFVLGQPKLTGAVQIFINPIAIR